jgi:hypothetical protein
MNLGIASVDIIPPGRISGASGLPNAAKSRGRHCTWIPDRSTPQLFSTATAVSMLYRRGLEALFARNTPSRGKVFFSAKLA